MKISVIAPVKNEVDFIGYSVMAVLPYVHEIIYTCAPSTDGTDELLAHLCEKYAGDKLKAYYSIEPGEIGERAGNFDFDPLDMPAYNAAYNYAINRATGDVIWFLHPDMIVTNPEAIPNLKPGPLAWFTNLTSYARDVKTEIVSGRGTRWKNIHVNDFGLHYWGAYGSQNEDLYFQDITGDAHQHFNEDFEKYPFEVADSEIRINHYCELKSYKRRFEKMLRCLRTLHPKASQAALEEMAAQHPRVSLEQSSQRFGVFAFAPSKVPPPEVFRKYGSEFSAFKKEPVCA